MSVTLCSISLGCLSIVCVRVYININVHYIKYTVYTSYSHTIYTIFIIYILRIYNIHILHRYKYCKHMHILFIYLYIYRCLYAHSVSTSWNLQGEFAQTIGHTSVLKHQASPRLLGILRMEEGGGTTVYIPWKATIILKMVVPTGWW